MESIYGGGFAPTTILPAVFDERRMPGNRKEFLAVVVTRTITFLTIVLVFAFSVGQVLGIASLSQLWYGLTGFTSLFEDSGRRGDNMDFMIPLLIVACFVESGIWLYKELFGAYRRLEVDRNGVTLHHKANLREHYPWEFLCEIDKALGDEWLVASRYQDGRPAEGPTRPRISLTQFDPSWRTGQIGALIGSFAPRLLLPKPAA